MPATKEMVGVVIGEKAAKQLNAISLSDNTVKLRIEDVAEDALKQLASRIRESSCYALQIDESTDIASLSNLYLYLYLATKMMPANFKTVLDEAVRTVNFIKSHSRHICHIMRRDGEQPFTASSSH